MSLTPEELRILKNYEERKKRHAEAQAEYRKKQKETNENYTNKYNEYMREYNKKRTEQIKGLQQKVSNTKATLKSPDDLIK